MITPEIVLYIMCTPHSVRGKTRSCDKLFTQNASGRSDSLYFKTVSLLYLLFLLYEEQIFSSGIRRNVLLSHPSPRFQTDSAESSSMGGFPMHHNGTCSTFYLHSGDRPKSFPAFDLLPETWYPTPNLEENSLRRSTTKEEESVRSWKIFYKSTLHHITTQFMNLCKVLNPVQTP